MTPEPADFEVVFLCTGNRFRSPLAEALLRRLLRDVPVRVHSFGTLDLPPLPALDGAVAEASRLELDLSAHRARRLRGEDLSEADLVIGFERHHVVAAVVDASAPRERTFTLPELVELLERVEPPAVSEPLERARTALSLVEAARPRDRRAPAELADPLGLGPVVAREAADRVDDLTRRLASRLFGIA